MVGKPTTRARQARFLASFDTWPGNTARDAVSGRIVRHGLEWLTDEQLADITADVAGDALDETRRRIRNRNSIRKAA